MAVAFVQGKSASNSTGNASATFTGTPTSGNLLVAVLSLRNQTITPPAGWTQVDLAGWLAGLGQLGIYYKVSAGSESGAQTWTLGTNDWWALGIAEYSGTATSSALVTNAIASGDTGGGQPASGSTGGSAASGDLVIGTCALNSGALTAGSGFTARTLSPASGAAFGTSFGAEGGLEDKASGGGTESASWTTDGYYWACSVAVFAQASAGASSFPHYYYQQLRA